MCVRPAGLRRPRQRAAVLTIKVGDSERAPSPIRFVVNWFNEPNRCVPIQR
jgi:hypothetical protein